jgi:hypothetical protein
MGNQRSLLACAQFDRFKENRDDFRTGRWKNPTSSMQQIAIVTEKVARWIITSSSVERGFSIAGAIAWKGRMRITGHNLAAQLMVQANWSIAKRFLAEILALGPEG